MSDETNNVPPAAPGAVLPAEPVGDDSWDVTDVARFLKASESWVYHAAQRGELPAVRYGRMLRFDPTDVRAWREARKSRPANVVNFPKR